MTQNTSHAVMAQRAEPHDSLDFFPTPPWATRALCEWIESKWGSLDLSSCWEPACGVGDMVRSLDEYFNHVSATDVCEYGFGHQLDFLFPGEARPHDWIITNPPFRLAEQFAHRAFSHSKKGVALFVRTSFLEGVGRHETLFSENRPEFVLQFTERVPIHKGRLTADGSTATAYCWVIWLYPFRASWTYLDWIRPCRKRLERAEDYAEAAA